jgi:hypothetical protein
MYQGQFMTLRLWGMGIFMESWKIFSIRQGQSVALTWPLDRYIGIPLQIVPGPIWFFGTNTSQEEIGATEKRQATSAQQTAEWGMRMIQTLFPRIKDYFVYKELCQSLEDEGQTLEFLAVPDFGARGDFGSLRPLC